MKRLIFLLVLFASISIFSQKIFTGCIPTPAEELEKLPVALPHFLFKNIPPAFDLSDKMPPAGFQGDQSSCTAWAVAYAYRSYAEKLQDNVTYWNKGKLNLETVFSPSFIYNQTNGGKDQGALIPRVLAFMVKQGAVKWSDMPYRADDFKTQPSLQLKEKAKKYRIDEWKRVNSADSREVKSNISLGYPVIIAAVIDTGFVYGGFRTGGKDYVWKTKTLEAGYHAMLVVGYSDDKKAFKVINSWGRDWGNDGYFWVSYSLFPTVVKEAYIMMRNASAYTNNNTTQATTGGSSLTSREFNSLLETEQADFKLVGYEENVIDSKLGNVVKLTGTVKIPEGLGKTFQMMIKIYANDGNSLKGGAIEGLVDEFTGFDGNLGATTDDIKIEKGEMTWSISIPVSAFNFTKIKSDEKSRFNFLAEPILFVDDYGIRAGDLFSFAVTKK